MPRNQSDDHGQNHKNKHSNPERRTFWITVLWSVLWITTTGGLFVILVWVCRTYFDPPKDTEVGIPATVALFGLVAVVAQIVVNIKQWRTTQEALRQQREMFDLVERPSIGLEIEHPIIEQFQPLQVRAILTNSGKSPAVKVTTNIFIDVAVTPPIGVCVELEKPEIDGIISTAVLAIGQSRASTIASKERLTVEDVRGILLEKTSFYVRVRVEYFGLDPDRMYFLDYFGRYNPSVRTYDLCESGNDAN